MKDILEMLQSLKEDKPELVITDDIIRQYVEDNIDLVIKEIKELWMM